ncbi:MAG: hypothetical protein QOI12_4505 [Alphaproteobacteria bacterium]|jgi:hypothetical protein|nr:hypothetical protein [Alphaproteobacteria bacterium]
MTTRFIGPLLCGGLLMLATATSALAQFRQGNKTDQYGEGRVLRGEDIPSGRVFYPEADRNQKPICVVKRVKKEGMPVEYVKVCS